MGLCDGCPPFGGAICGITDTFNRPNAGGLGIADCGRTWAVQLAEPMTIEGNEMRVPTRIVGDRVSSLPGDYPVPFNGRIYGTSADIHAGFSYVTTRGVRPEGFGPAWNDAFGYVDGIIAHVGGYLPPGPTSGVSPDALAAPDDRRHFNPESPVTVTGYIKMVETEAGTSGLTLDEYIRVSLGLFVGIGNANFLVGGPSDQAILVIDDGLGTFVYSYFPANWWATVGEAAFTISYSGGHGGTVTADVGGVTVSTAIDAGAWLNLGCWGASNFSSDTSEASGVPCAEMQISDLFIGGKLITDLNWEWRLNGIDAGGGGVSFRFGYVSMGGAVPFDFLYPDSLDGLWPYNVATPAVWAWQSGGQLTAVPLGGDLAWPFTAVVTIIGTTATLTIGGVSASVTTERPMSTLIDTLGGLSHVVRNGQGTYVKFNDLDIVGVNLCTETGITTGGPGGFQPVNDEYVALGDGATTAFTTNAPYIAGTLQVQVAGMLVDIDSTHPASGAFTLVDPPPAGAEIRASYTVAATPPPAGDRPFAPPVTTATYNVPPAYVTFAEVNDWIDTVVPDGSRIEFPPGGSYSGAEGIQLGNRSHLDIRGNGSTFGLTGAAGDHLSSGFVIGYSYSLGSFTGNSHHIAIAGFVIEGNDPTPGTFGGGENQQAVRINGSTFIEVSGCTIRAVYGDGVFSDNGIDVWVHGNHVETAGRNGLTVVQGARVLCESNVIDEVGYVTFDLEPNFSTEASDDITFRNNIAGTWDLDFVSVDGGFRGAPISNVFITGNVTTVKALHCAIDNGSGVNGNVGARMTNIVFSGNSSAVPAAGPRLFFAHIDGLVITGNDQPLTSGVLTDVDDCTGVVGP